MSGAKFKYGAAGEAITTIGTAIPVGDYLLVAGIAELTYETGVKITIEAPASFVLINQERIELIEGKLSAHVPEDGVGFTVDTPHAAVVDLGTDFGVEVLDQNAEVHVKIGSRCRSSLTDSSLIDGTTPWRLLTAIAFPSPESVFSNRWNNEFKPPCDRYRPL